MHRSWVAVCVSSLAITVGACVAEPEREDGEDSTTVVDDVAGTSEGPQTSEPVSDLLELPDVPIANGGPRACVERGQDHCTECVPVYVTECCSWVGFYCNQYCQRYAGCQLGGCIPGWKVCDGEIISP